MYFLFLFLFFLSILLSSEESQMALFWGDHLFINFCGPSPYPPRSKLIWLLDERRNLLLQPHKRPRARAWLLCVGKLMRSTCLSCLGKGKCPVSWWRVLQSHILPLSCTLSSLWWRVLKRSSHPDHLDLGRLPDMQLWIGDGNIFSGVAYLE